MIVRALLLVTLVGLCIPRDAVADPPATRSLAAPKNTSARVRLQAGNQAYAASRWENAIEEYQAGASLEAAPIFDFNLGQAHRKLGRYERALIHYERFIKIGKPTGDVLDTVEGLCAEMRAHLANRALTMPPTGAAPLPERGTASRSPASTAVSSVEKPPSTPRSLQPDQDAVSTRSELPHRTPTRWVGWTSAGIGVAAVGASGYLFLRAGSMQDDAENEPDVRHRIELRDGAQTRRLAGTITGIGGVALLATGVVLLATHNSSPGDRTVQAGVSGTNVVVFGRF